MLKNCKYCNKEFKTKPSHYERRMYCSRKCHNTGRQTHEFRNCIICNASFKCYPDRKNVTGQFCSLQCKGKHFKHAPIIKICEYCKISFTLTTYYKIKKYCSIECYAKSMEGTEKPSFYEVATEDEKLTRLKKSFDKFAIKNENDCWGWSGSLAKIYGSLQYGGKYKSISAHRASWLIHRGPIPEGMWVLHNCPRGDDPRCNNPDHLFLGTPTDNVHDMHKKGRAIILKGEDTLTAKLTESQVIEIKQLLKQNNTLQSIAHKFNVHLVTIFDIKHKKTWKHIGN